MTNAIITKKNKHPIIVKTRGVSAITTGLSSHIITENKNENAITINDYSNATTEGNLSLAITTGTLAYASTKGWASHAITGGNFSRASVKGKNSVACALGADAEVRGELGNWLVATEWGYNKEIDEHILMGVVTAKVDGKKIKPNKWYRAENGKLVECFGF